MSSSLQLLLLIFCLSLSVIVVLQSLLCSVTLSPDTIVVILYQVNGAPSSELNNRSSKDDRSIFFQLILSFFSLLFYILIFSFLFLFLVFFFPLVVFVPFSLFCLYFYQMILSTFNPRRIILDIYSA